MARNIWECKPSGASQASVPCPAPGHSIGFWLNCVSLDLLHFFSCEGRNICRSPPLDSSCVLLNKAAVSSDLSPSNPRDPPPSTTSLTPPSRRNPRWVRSDKESPAVQTVGGNRRGVVGGTHQHIYFIEIKIYAHKQTTEYPERSQGWWFGGGGSAVRDRTFYNSTLDGKSGNSTLEAAVLARICVQYDRLVLINTFQEGAVPTFGAEG